MYTITETTLSQIHIQFHVACAPENRTVHIKQYNRHCPHTSIGTLCSDGCYAIHPVDGASQ